MAIPLLHKLTLKKPVLDCRTRWMSTSAMLEQLLELQEFCDDFFSREGELSLTEDWQGIENAVAALAPAEKATVELQREQLTVGDLYGT